MQNLTISECIFGAIALIPARMPSVESTIAFILLTKLKK